MNNLHWLFIFSHEIIPHCCITPFKQQVQIWTMFSLLAGIQWANQQTTRVQSSRTRTHWATHGHDQWLAEPWPRPWWLLLWCRRQPNTPPEAGAWSGLGTGPRAAPFGHSTAAPIAAQVGGPGLPSQRAANYRPGQTGPDGPRGPLQSHEAPQAGSIGLCRLPLLPAWGASLSVVSER